MESRTEYMLISTDDYDAVKPAADWTLYPGNRRTNLLSSANGPPEESVLMRTGGNALQAVRKDALKNENYISVIAPEGKDQGDTIMVACPYVNGRLFLTTIPKGVYPGHVFLVRTAPFVPKVFMGVPVARSADDNNFIERTAVDDLTFGEEIGDHSTPGRVEADHEFEMVDRNVGCTHVAEDTFEIVDNQNNPSTPVRENGWVGAYFATKFFS